MPMVRKTVPAPELMGRRGYRLHGPMPMKEIDVEVDEVGNEIGDAQPAGPLTGAHVDAERDRRIAAGFVFNGVLIQSRPSDRENLAGASTAALAAIMGGAEAGNLRWHGGDSDFAWISADNALVPLDAQAMFALGQKAMAHKQQMIFAARAIKDMTPLPANYADDVFWPADPA